MPADLTDAAWVLGVPREELLERVGVVTLVRAERYAAEGRVRTLVSGAGGELLLATVVGTHRRLYQTIVRRLGDGSAWRGQCSCPVSTDCKHAVAVVVEAQRRLTAGGAALPGSWESVLAPLVTGQSSSDPEGTAPAEVPLALQVEVEGPPVAGPETARVLLRPVRPGRGRRWVRTGVSWRDLSGRWSSPDVRADHREAVAQLHAVARGAGQYSPWAAEQLSVGDLGPVLWPLLRRCLAAGVELVPGGRLAGVRVGSEPASLVVDLTRQEDGGLTLRSRVVADPAPSGGRHFVLGRPAHGVAHLDDAGALTLWPLDRPPPAAAVPLLERAEPLQVPAEDVERFLALYYPLVARQLPLSSRDGSVPAASAAFRPRLLLRLTADAGHVLHLGWALSYAVPDDGSGGGTTRTTVALDAGGPRDRVAEAELLAGVVPLLDAVPSLVDRAARPVPRPHARATLVGHQTARFVAELLPVLRDREDVEVVVEGDLPDYGEAQEAPVVHLTTSAGETQDWFDLHVQVTVAGESVSFSELFSALARGDEVLLLGSGTWFTLDQPELHRLRRLIEEARELDDRSPVQEGRLRVTAYQAGLWEDLVALGVVDEQDSAWRERVDALLRLGDQDRGTVLPPAGLRAQLRPYQLEGYRWLSTLWDAGLGGVLADDMGLGKTLQTLAAVARAEQRGDLAEGPVLVVAPTSVVPTWVQEAARFTPDLRAVAVTATRRRRGETLTDAVAAADVVVTSWTLLRLEADDYAALPWAAVVLDEAQYVKNHRSATYAAVRRLAGRRTVAITGTPLENSLMDLWSITSLAAPGLFPRPEVFTDRYRRPIEAGGDPEVLDRLRRRLRPFLLRRTKSEVAAELPAKIEQTLHIALHPAHQRVYDRHLQRERQRVLGLLEDLDRNRMAIFRALTVLRQLALDPALVSDEHAGLATSAKVTALVEQLTELAAEGHRALVFSSFTGYLRTVRAALDEAGIPSSYLDGRTRDRAARIAAFREGDDPVFLVSLKAGGVGLTLTEADYVFVLDPWWNPAAEAQAVDRTHRIGQTRPVNVYRMVSTGTVEEKVVALQQRKRDLFASVVDSGQFRSGAVSAEDIRGLLEG